MRRCRFATLLSAVFFSLAAMATTTLADEPGPAKPVEPAAAEDAPKGDAAEATEPGELAESASEAVHPLDELDWMVGTWEDNSDGVRILTTCSWAANRSFLTRRFQVEIEGKIDLQGTQVIGWDPNSGKLRSWTFDSTGGFGEGRLTRDGDRWICTTMFTLASGERASAINIMRYIDPDTFGWQSIGREVGGELQPNIAEVQISRVQEEESVDAETAGTVEDSSPASSKENE